MRPWDGSNLMQPHTWYQVCSSFQLRFMIWLVGGFWLFLDHALGCVALSRKEILQYAEEERSI